MKQNEIIKTNKIVLNSLPIGIKKLKKRLIVDKNIKPKNEYSKKETLLILI